MKKIWQPFRKKKYDYREARASWFSLKRKEIKQKLIELKGGKCKICGYDKPVLSAYDFHHRDPNEKCFGISSNTNCFEKLVKEAEKCDLLCRNCHAEVTEQWNKERSDKLFSQQEQLLKQIGSSAYKPDINTLLKMLSATNVQAVARYFNVYPHTINKWKRIQKVHCSYCNTEFLPTKRTQKYCKEQCNRLASRRVDRPGKQALSQMLKEQSWTSIGRKYGVSDNAVRKWARQYGLLE